LEAGGLSPRDALHEARRRFGNPTLHHEDAREVWLTRLLSELAQDLKYGLRTLAKNKAFSALAVLSLALGIGANTAIYSLMESILLRNLPVAEPESLVVLSWHSRPPGQDRVHVVHSLNGLFYMGSKDSFAAGIFPYAAFETLSRDNRVFSSLFAYSNARHRNLTAQGQAASVSTEYVSGAFFSTLAVNPAAGRLLSPADDQAGAPATAVLSLAAAQQRFGSAQAAIGQPVRIDNVPFTIVGVTPGEFFGIDAADTPALYLPLHASLLLDGPHAGQLFHDPNHYAVELMGRLRPGVSLAQAQAALAPLFHNWVAATATSAAERERLPNLRLEPGAAGLGRLRREYSKPLYVLFSMVALILTITCANLANLLLARAAARRREMAVRLSLGASRLRVVRQLLTESVLLASFGGALGVVFAYWGVRTLTLLFSNGREDFTFRAGLNWNVLAATAALSLLCGLLFGLVPALQSTRPDVMPSLKDGRGPASGGRTQRLLVVAQIAMSFVILVAAGLFIRTLDQLQSVQLGYNRENLLTFSLNARQTGHRAPEIATFYSDLRQRFEALPGVTGASFAHASLLHASMAGGTLRGRIRAGNVLFDNTSVIAAGPRYLTTMQIPLAAGREIDSRDQRSAPPVALISQRLARTYFPNENPIGRRIQFVDEKREFEIIGITADLRLGSPKRENPLTIFVPLAQIEPLAATYALRTTGAPLALVDQVREIVRQADATLPVTNISTQAAEIDRTLSREITFAKLCTGFALLALLTACLGLYGTMYYSVSRRISEIGIRMALGAPRSAMLWMVLRQVLILAAIGLTLSLPAALFGGRLLKSLLYGTQPYEPGVLAGAALALVAAALLAGYAPARRAARIDPLVALRHD